MSIGARIYAELRGDRVIWMIVAVLAMFSILAVYSATGSLAYRMQGGNTEAYLMKHVVILGFGLFLAYLAYLMHYQKYNRVAPWLMVIAIPLLVYTVAMGTNINEARRWISIPYVGITFQTSDFAKLALILYVAREISRHKDYIKDLKNAFVPIIVPVLIVCGLIAPADLSTSLLLFGTCVVMMFVGRVAIKYIFLLVFLWLVVFTFLVTLGQFFPDVVRTDTWTSRIAEFQSSPEGGYQVKQAKIAIANGDVIGVGPGNSVQRNYLPAPYADFIYAIICEEYGLVGGFIILGLYVLLFFRVASIVSKDPVKAFGMMVIIGLSLNMVLQALANMAVSVHLIPVTGLTLPLVSLGGTSILFSCIFFGIILSVSKYVEGTSVRAQSVQSGIGSGNNSPNPENPKPKR